MTLRLPALALVSLASLAAVHCGSTAAEPHVDPGHPATDAGHPATDAAHPTTDAAHPTTDSGEACVPKVPTVHVPTASACPTTRPPSLPGDGGLAPDGGFDECTSDSQCTMGVNGRCQQVGRQIIAYGCTYDECSSASACAAENICVCGTPDGADAGRSANTCLPSNCSSDADCGADGYCSPTYDTMCGPYDGVVGYYCHKAANECTVDDCVDDSDCTKQGGGYCAWDGESSKWTCANAFCSG